MAGEKKDIVGVVLMTLDKSALDVKKNWKEFRLVQWVIDGKPKSVKLEKRGFYQTIDGDIRMAKAEGLVLADMEILKVVEAGQTESNFARVMKFMKNPPAYKPEPKPAAGADGTIEEIPF